MSRRWSYNSNAMYFSICVLWLSPGSGTPVVDPWKVGWGQKHLSLCCWHFGWGRLCFTFSLPYMTIASNAPSVTIPFLSFFLGKRKQSWKAGGRGLVDLEAPANCWVCHCFFTNIGMNEPSVLSTEKYFVRSCEPIENFGRPLKSNW